jgi:hypothetical protein
MKKFSREALINSSLTGHLKSRDVFSPANIILYVRRSINSLSRPLFISPCLFHLVFDTLPPIMPPAGPISRTCTHSRSQTTCKAC